MRVTGTDSHTWSVAELTHAASWSFSGLVTARRVVWLSGVHFTLVTARGVQSRPDARVDLAVHLRPATPIFVSTRTHETKHSAFTGGSPGENTRPGAPPSLEGHLFATGGRLHTRDARREEQEDGCPSRLPPVRGTPFFLFHCMR